MGTSSNDPALGGVLEHFGVKGMHWGVRKSDLESAKTLAGHAANATKLRKDQTKAKNQATVQSKGGLHQVSDAELKKMIARMEMEKKYQKFMSEDADRRKEGLKAVGKVLEQVGKIGAPILAGMFAKHVYANRETYRTKAYIARRAIGR